jgi:hypothetical protein
MLGRRGGVGLLRKLCTSSSSNPAVAVAPDDPEVLRLLNSMAGLDLNRVMAKRREALVVPHYQLMTLEQLQQVSLFIVCIKMTCVALPTFYPFSGVRGWDCTAL